MYKLLLDIGNTSLKAAVADGYKILTIRRSEDFRPEFLRPLVEQYRLAAAIVSSVRGDGVQTTEWLRTYIDKVWMLSHKTPIPIRNCYATPASLGVDRLATAVGAATFFPQRECLIIDCGTAMTIDLLSAAGEFLGGNISPGLQMRFKALHSFTAALPLGYAGSHTPPVGGNTQEAVEAGVVQGAVNELEGYLTQYPACTPVFTGGDAFYFAERIKKPIFVIANLNFIGLAKIVEHNVHI